MVILRFQDICVKGSTVLVTLLSYSKYTTNTLLRYALLWRVTEEPTVAADASCSADFFIKSILACFQLGPWREQKLQQGFIDVRWAQTYEYGYVPNPSLENVFMSVAFDLPDFHSPIHSQPYLEGYYLFLFFSHTYIFLPHRWTLRVI